MEFFSWLPFLKKSRLPWWVVIQTTIPRCTYYFGPFESAEEAKSNQAGYLEDLRAEGAQGISLKIEQGQPKELTIDEEE
jgi:Domain of unknown function (DUF1816)